MDKSTKNAVRAVAVAVCGVVLMSGCETVSFEHPSFGSASESTLRQLVLAELREAQRLGLITVGEEDVPSMNEAQLRTISQAVEEATVGEVIYPR